MHHLIDDRPDETLGLRSIHERLDRIMDFLEKEIGHKQHQIDDLEGEMIALKTVCEEKNALIGKLENQLAEYRQTGEGTRQLINKLLNDISNYQKDIEWYKRTFVKRSVAGTIWQKLFRK